MQKKRSLLSAILNLIVFVLTVRSIAEFFISGGGGNMAVYGCECFRYFTIDSNILCALSGLVALIYQFGNRALNKFAFYIRYVGTCAVVLTFFTVIVYIGPSAGYPAVFDGVNIYLHLVNPIIAMANFLLLEDSGSDVKFSVKNSLLGMIPSVAYGFVYIVMVIVLELWDDVYYFNAGGYWYISMIVMSATTILLNLALRKTYLLTHKKQK